MPETDPLFQEMTDTLQQARGAMHSEMELLQAQDSDRETLLRLLDAARSFADQADALVLLMTDSRAEDASIGRVNAIAAFFWQTEERIEGMLGLGRG